MGCPSECVIGDNLVFTITTHDPDTGVLTDASASPDYRVYEDETAAAIDTGKMDKLDADNTTGFYAHTLTCSSGNGYEDGKTYSIYIEATVDGDKGGISYGFKAITDPADRVADEEYDNDGTAISLRGAIKLMLGVLTGKSSGGGTTTLVFRDINDSKNRISATVDSDGNRTAVGTRDAT
jgi:hypothetical protein